MTADLVSQLERYTAAVVDQQTPITATEAQALVGAIRELPDVPQRGIPPRRGLMAAAAAAVVILLLVGAVSWLAQQGEGDVVDETTTTTVGVLGPGSWAVAAVFTNPSVAPELMASTVDEIFTWPGVIDVAGVEDEAAWLQLTGLTCGIDELGVPCGTGIVALVTETDIAAVAQRLEAEFEMVATTAMDDPTGFVQAYYSAVLEQASPPPLNFDPGVLGVELVLGGPFVGISGEQCARQCDILVELEYQGSVLRSGMWLGVEEGGLGAIEVGRSGGFRGTGFTLGDLLIDGSGRGGLIALFSDTDTGERLHALAGLPVEAAVVTFETDGGTVFWQRPLAGMALYASAAGDFVATVSEVVVLDADGAEIIAIDRSGAARNLRIAADEPAPATTAAPASGDDPPTATANARDVATSIVGNDVQVVDDQTPLGAIQWRVVGFGDTPPPRGPYLITPSGYAALDFAPEQFNPATTHIWLSDDGTTWQAVPSPVPGLIVDARNEGDLYILETVSSISDLRYWHIGATRPKQVWQSTDFEAWTPVEAPPRAAPTASGIGVVAGANLRATVTAGDRTFSDWDSYLWIDWVTVIEHVTGQRPSPVFGDPYGAAWDPGSGILQLALYDREGQEAMEEFARLRLSIAGSTEAWVAELYDPDTGELVGSIESTLPVGALDEVPSILVDGYRARVGAVSSADGVELVEPEWIASVPFQDRSQPALVAIGDEFFAYLRTGDNGRPAEGEDGHNSVWRSRDGRTWENLGTPPWPDTHEIANVRIEERDGVAMVIVLMDAERSKPSDFLMSTDGITWRSPSAPPPPFGNPWGIDIIAGGHGWILAGPPPNIWGSADGDIWEPLASEGLPGWTAFTANGDRIIYLADAVNHIVFGALEPN